MNATHAETSGSLATSTRTSLVSLSAIRKATLSSIAIHSERSIRRVRRILSSRLRQLMNRHAADQGATGIVEMLFCTSLVALVGAADTQPANSPRKLQIVNTKVRFPPTQHWKSTDG